MRKNHISVMTLEEYEPNREFVGRNFNAGEVVQLVLRSRRTGRWLPFKYVQMVMMHELAHCKQMNHSRAFWAVRNQYAAQMYELWREGYTGDGIWGRGANRTQRRKRRAKPPLTYQERKQRRILKKFGENGVALGADEEAKVKLEKGKKVKAKPRVAGSARGRELRAAAALARFEQQKVDVEEDDGSIKDEDETDSGSASGGEYEESPLDAVDADGTRLVDGKGRGMVKVCEDEDADDPDARNELTQLQDMFQGHVKREVSHGGPTLQHGVRIKDEPTEGYDKPTASIPVKREPDEDLPQIHLAPPERWKPASVKEEVEPASNSALMERTMPPSTSTCSVCSFENDTVAATCSMCANVLNPAITPDIWRCALSSCKNNGYVNSGDCGLCGLCGQRRDV